VNNVGGGREEGRRKKPPPEAAKKEETYPISTRPYNNYTRYLGPDCRRINTICLSTYRGFRHELLAFTELITTNSAVTDQAEGRVTAKTTFVSFSDLFRVLQ
jgi:hypothetical protein